MQALAPERQKRFFLRGTGRFEGKARVRPEIAATIEFLRVNLMDADWPITPGLDAIFCRNVMIYFDRELQNRVHELFYTSLAPFGILALGSKETLRFTRFEDRYETVNAREKLKRKGCDLVIANDVSKPGIGFDSDRNEVLLVFPDHTEALPEDEKHHLAPRIVREIEGLAALKAGA